MPYDKYFGGATEDFHWFERVLDDSGSGLNRPAAVIVETVQGEGGLNVARIEWLQVLADLCHKRDILLIVDDGLPMALTPFRRELDVWAPGEHNGTVRGHNPAFITATTALETYRQNPDLGAETVRKGDFMRARLEHIAVRHDGVAARGRGMARGLKFDRADLASKVCRAAFDRGALMETSDPSDEVVKLLPPLTTSQADLEIGLEILAEAVTGTVA